MPYGEALELLVNPQNGLPMFMQNPTPAQLTQLKKSLDAAMSMEELEDMKSRPLEEQIENALDILDSIKDTILSA